MKKLLRRYITLQIIKKTIAMFLLVVIGLSDLATTVVYAQQAAPTGEIAEEKNHDGKIATLLTDTEKAPAMPFIGEGRGVKSVIPAMADFATSGTTANFVVPARVRKLAKENYRPNEEIAVVIENGVEHEYEATLIDAIGNKVAVDADEVETGAAKVLLIEQPSSFRPGKYTLQITDERGGVSTQDFTWGVLAVNPDKSVYSPNETAKLAFGVLDEGGNMVCDAQVELQITSPLGQKDSLSTDNGKIRINEECKSHDFTLNPDYDAEYKVGGAGVYQMLLKAQTKNGAYSISDAFEVRDNVPFDVKRVTATRIYPPNVYPVTMEIVANQDFEGTITETVPASFRIAPQGSEIKDNTNFDPTASGSAAVQAPDNLPKATQPEASPVIAYNTVNNVQESIGGPSVLGASIPGLGMPFAGPFPISQEFGQSLVQDVHDHDLYASFGMQGHDGIDFAMPEGTPLLAVDGGKVLLAGDGDYGITVVIEHSWGRSYYGHLSSVDVKEGQEVARGATIAKSGNTGISTGPHLHFGIKPRDPNTENGFYGKVDPAYYLGLKQSAGQVLGVAASLASAPAFKSPGYDEFMNETVDTDVKVLTWKVNVKKGDKIAIGYSYLAPRISPQFYTLGPATFTDTSGKEVFHETRKWQIASDALEYKFKRGSFTKSTCTAPCTQSVAGVGFKGKAVLFEWTLQTSAGISTNVATDGQHMGTGFATSSSQERSIDIFSEDAAATSDSCRIRSDTKAITMIGTNCNSGAGTVTAAADFVSFDSDGFTLNWTTNNASAYIIHYTVLGGADVSNVKAGTFTLTTGSLASLSVTDPGFQPDFVMIMGTGTEAVNTVTATAKMNYGFASSATKEMAYTNIMESANATAADTCNRMRMDAIITTYTPDGTGTTTCGAQDSLVDFTSFDATGFTLYKTDAPAANTDMFYLAIQGGVYDVGSFTQKTSPGESSVYTGFRPSGVMLASANGTTNSLTANSALSLGGASRENNVPWCNDTTGVSCFAEGASNTVSQNTDWCNDTTGVTCTAPGTEQTTNRTDWCNDTTGVTCTSSWSSRRKITFDIDTSNNLTNFAVLVKLNSSRIDYNKTQNSGQDIRFVDPSDQNTVLSHEIESWDESGDSYVWVKVPQINGNSTTDSIWMYYGNASASDGQDTSNVWDSNYNIVYHMEESGGNITDSAGTAQNAVRNGTTVSQASGKVGFGQDFGTTGYLETATPGLPTGDFSYSTWVYFDTATDESVIMVSDGSAGALSEFRLYSGGSGLEVTVDQTGREFGTQAATSTWMHVSIVRSGSTTTVYRNGTAVASNTSTLTEADALNFNGCSLILGMDADALCTGTPGNYLDGRLDEFRVSNTSRSAEWVRAEYLSQADSINVFGSEQSYEVTSQSGWLARKKITFNNSASTENLTNFPVLVKLNAERIDYSKTKNSGEDIRFVDPADPNTVLSHEIETWNEGGDSYVWVEVPQIDAGSKSDFVWMYYNNNSATDGQDITGSWDSNYAGVWHMNETSGQHQDSTTNANNATTTSVTTQGSATGKVNGASDFNNASNTVTVPDAATLDLTNAWTLSVWVNPDTLTGASGFYCPVFKNNYYICFTDANNVDAGFISTTNTFVSIASTNPVVQLDQLQHYQLSFNNSTDTMTLYKNGTQIDQVVNAAGNPDLDANALIGSDATFRIGINSAGLDALDGIVDEVRLSNSVRSTDWIEAEYVSTTDNMNSFGSEITYGQGTASSSGWSERKKITFNNSASAENLIDFPVLVRLNSSRIDYTKTQNSGQDIRFVDPSDPSTVLSHEIESWNESGDSYVWVKVPQLDAGSRTDHIWMYYNNPSASDGQDATKVWDNNYKAVYHMDESSGTTNADSTINANTGTKSASNEPNPSATGPIGNAQDFDNNNDYVRANDNNSLDLSTNGTVSVWFNRDGTGSWDSLVAKGDSNSANAHNYSFLFNTSSTLTFIMGNGSANQTLDTVTTLTSTSTDYHTVGTWDGSTVRLFVNGAQNTSTTQVMNPAGNTATLRIGEFGGNVDYFDGSIDEVRISNVTRSAEWIEAEYVSGADTMNTFGTAEVYGVGAQTFTEGSIWGDDIDSQGTENAIMATSLTKVIQLYGGITSSQPTAAAAEADMQSFDSTGFTLNWTTADTNARMIAYWAVGSVTATQEDYRWYKNANSLTPGNALEDENSSTIVAKNKPHARLRTNLSVGGNGLNASQQNFKLQYAAAGAVAGASSVSDWCNDTTGVTCTAPGVGENIGSPTTDWCNDTTGVTCTSDWSSRRKITFNNASSSAALTDFPVLVKIDSKRINYNKTQSDGDDLRFVDPSDPTVALNHEIEGTWTNSGTNYVWVKVPQIDGRSNTDYIWMYYGNSTVSSPASQLGNATHATGVWNSAYELVHHLEETAACSSLSISDSTTNAHSSTCSGPTSNASSKVGNGRTFDGVDDGISITHNADFEPAGAGVTMELWANLDVNSGYQSFFSKYAEGGYAFTLNGDFGNGCVLTNSMCWFDSGVGDVGISTPLTTSTWTHFAVVKSGTVATMYINGIRVGTTAATSPMTSNTTVIPLRIGTDSSSNGDFDGSMDEVRYSTTARSADWMLANYMTQNDQFNTFGSEFTYTETQQQSSGWGYRKKITFDNSASAENLTDFPVLVKLDASRIDYNKTQDDGGDIRFVDPSDPTTVLSHEIETWNENGNSFVWVKVPQLDNGSTSDYMYMYYGNPGVADGQNATGVWDSNYQGVWHLNQNPGTAGSEGILDATMNNNDGTDEGSMTSSDQVTGKMGNGIDFDGGDDIVRFGDTTSLEISSYSSWTMSGWVNAATITTMQYPVIYSYGVWEASLGLTDTTVGTDGRMEHYRNNLTNLTSNTAITTGSWRYITVTRNASTTTFYLDGVADGSGTSITINNVTDGSAIGNTTSAPGNIDGGFLGVLDEIRVSSTERSADWIEAEYLSGADRLNIFGDEQSYTVGGTTTNGWIDVADVWCNDASGVTCDTSWSYRKRITINNQSSTSNLTNFPVLVKLNSSRIDYTKTQDDGDDIRFVDPADPTTVLSHEVETWNENGDSYVWVEVPQLDAKSSADSIWMYYGNASIGSGQDATGTWDSNFQLVQHLKENPAGSAPQMQDSTTNNRDGTSNGSMTVDDQVSGKIDGSLDFDGSNDYVGISDFYIQNQITVSTWAWRNPADDNAKDYTHTIGKWVYDGATTNDEWGTGIHDGQYSFWIETANNRIGLDGNGEMPRGEWVMITMTYDGSTVRGYVNGVQVVSSAATGTIDNTTTTISIGRNESAQQWLGKIDEARLSDTARSADWVRAEYLTGMDQMNTFGNEETQTSSAWRFKDNSSVTNGQQITTSVLGTSATGSQLSYQESNISALNPASIAVGEKREFDFSLDGTNASARRTYYFRIVNADGTPLTSYTRYPAITVGVPNQKVMRGGKFFNYKQVQPFSF